MTQLGLVPHFIRNHQKVFHSLTTNNFPSNPHERNRFENYDRVLFILVCIKEKPERSLGNSSTFRDNITSPDICDYPGDLLKDFSRFSLITCGWTLVVITVLKKKQLFITRDEKETGKILCQSSRARRLFTSMMVSTTGFLPNLSDHSPIN